MRPAPAQRGERRIRRRHIGVRAADRRQIDARARSATGAADRLVARDGVLERRDRVDMPPKKKNPFRVSGRGSG
jgi:hypothetical protein